MPHRRFPSRVRRIDLPPADRRDRARHPSTTQTKSEHRIHIRRATPDDGDTFLTLVDALADYEKLDRPTP